RHVLLQHRIPALSGIAPGFVLEAGLRAVHLRQRHHHAEAVVGELVDPGRTHAVAVFLLVADLVLVVARVDADHALVERQRPHRLQVDRARQALADERRVRGLVDHDLAHQLGRVLVELDAAVVAGARLLAAAECRGGAGAGAAAGVERGGAAAPALSGQAGQARDRLGDARIGQLADVLGRDRLHDRGRGLLGVDRALDGRADAGHLDAVELDGFLLVLLGGVLCKDLRRSKDDRGGERSAQQIALVMQHFPLPKDNVGLLASARGSARITGAPGGLRSVTGMLVGVFAPGAFMHTYSLAAENRARRGAAVQPRMTALSSCSDAVQRRPRAVAAARRARLSRARAGPAGSEAAGPRARATRLRNARGPRT